MGNRHSREKNTNPCKRKNNLELYLNDVFEKECTFEIKEEEVEFIKTGIEKLVQDIVDHILYSSFNGTISQLCCKIPQDRFFRKHDGMMPLNERCLTTEVYFPITSDNQLQNYKAEHVTYLKPGKSTIIKVGSFYDGTKNNFPDEFDFIFPVLGTSEYFPVLDIHVRKPKRKMPCFLEASQRKLISKRIEESLMSYTSSKQHQQTMKLKYDKFLRPHGPAFKIRFLYKKRFVKQRYIHVDLVPAYMIFDSHTLQSFKADVNRYVEPEEFRKAILKAESSLVVGDELAFTKVEKYFMKNILSKNHVKVSRILKYLINGHGDGEKLKEETNFRKAYYNSYHIKILMIYHHEACTHTDTEDLGPCVLQVLQEMSKYQSTKEFPRFTIEPHSLDINFEFELLPFLNSTIEALKLKQTSNRSYNYEREKVKSVSRQYLERIRRDLALFKGYS